MKALNLIAYIFIILICTTSIFACGAYKTTLSPQANSIKVADSHVVEDCKYVGSVKGESPGLGNAMYSVGVHNAKNEALEKASSLGATHVVWDSIGGLCTPTAIGKAYVCE